MTSYSGWTCHFLTVGIQVQLHLWVIPQLSIPFPSPLSPHKFLSFSFLWIPSLPYLCFLSIMLLSTTFTPLLFLFLSSSGRRLPSWRPTLWCYHHTSRKSAMLYNVHFKIKKINKMVSLPSDTKDTQHLSHTEIDANMARSLIPAGCVQRSSLQHLISEELC